MSKLGATVKTVVVPATVKLTVPSVLVACIGTPSTTNTEGAVVHVFVPVRPPVRGA